MNFSSTSRNLLALGVIMAFLSVALGAFGAHAMKQFLSAERLQVWQTAVDYQFYHALGLVLIGLIYQHQPGKIFRLSGWIMLTGMLIFSGSLYLLCLTDTGWLGAITPLGGTALLLSWLTLFAGILKNSA